MVHFNFFCGVHSVCVSQIDDAPGVFSFVVCSSAKMPSSGVRDCADSCKRNGSAFVSMGIDGS